MYLKAASQKLGIGVFNMKYFVHHTPDSFKYDVLDTKSFNEAKDAGRIFLDSDMAEPTSESVIFIYARPEDQQFVSEKIGVEDVVEIPEELQTAIAEIKALFGSLLCRHMESPADLPVC